MEVRIGVVNASRELSVETSQTADEIDQAVRDALSEGGVLRLQDERGRHIQVPGDKLAYVEVIPEAGRRVGFGG